MEFPLEKQPVEPHLYEVKNIQSACSKYVLPDGTLSLSVAGPALADLIRR
jgi:hypothetical protein